MVSHTVLATKTRLRGLFSRNRKPGDYYAALKFYNNGEYLGLCYAYDEDDITDAWDAIYEDRPSARLVRDEKAFLASI